MNQKTTGGHHARTGRFALCALAALSSLSLAACGGDSHHHRTETALSIDESTAPVAIDQTWSSLTTSPPLLAALIDATDPNYVVLNDCTDGGSQEQTLNDQNRVTSVFFDQCTQSYSFGSGPWFGQIIDGGLSFEYNENGDVSRIVAEQFSNELQLGDTNGRVDTADGVFELPEGTVSPLSYTANGTLTSFRNTAPSDPPNDIVLRFPGLSVIASATGDDDLLQVSGQLLIPGSDLPVELITEAPGIRVSPDSDCPIGGEITLEGAGSSYTSVLFNGADHITVTVNGVAQSERTCEQFLQWLAEPTANG
ncbi:hypothetical protein [Alloalcanivorax mobilis]|uniref:hypothetical protein n=1 Tax=Alloalcanivorax mobilis TaxID=2019569 RepID=UPI000B5B47AF|nr:hypothetical protein [Alloalcanivorax mobilis]ASK32998.1 hypothetical protein CEK62_00685 [Alcanivorax sp. N3-2A]ASK36816.1 hypothetical protein CEK62_20880 [Alcanivorax sp. N3-2A]|tara:strand:- start:18698 stop:19624 length:927 start_codon:yes stop_codon:yes gene_type:complete